MVNAFINLIVENQKPGMVVAELGCWTGESTGRYLPIIKKNNGRTILVDWFKGNITSYSEAMGKYDPSGDWSVYERLLTVINEVGCIDFVDIYREMTIQAVTKIPDKSVDIVFIDADHRYSGVKSDILTWLPKVKQGGILCGHDYIWAGKNYVNQWSLEDLELDDAFCPGQNFKVHAGVIQAVHEVFGDDFLVIPSDDMWIKRL